MTRSKISIVIILLLCTAIAALVIAAQDNPANDKPAAPKDPNKPAAVEDKKPPQSAPSDSGSKGASASDENAAVNDQMELPRESPLPALYKGCEVVFGQYLNKDGDVNYALLRRKRSDLFNILKSLENMHPAQVMAMNDTEKQAFWINVYNLCTLKLIVDNYPIEPKWYMILYPNNSVMQISNPWTKNYFKIQGLEYNLQEIEQELLLDRFRDPRICFALSNATRGGAFLRNEPYRAETLDKQLDDQVKNYLASPRGLKWNKDNNTLLISNLFNTYRDTFLKSRYAEIKKFRNRKDDEKAWLNFLVAFLPEDQKKLLETTDYSFQFIDYDWKLNEFSAP